MRDENIRIRAAAPEDAAQLLNVTPRTITNYVRAGRLKGQLIGKARMFTREELERFLRGE